MGEPSRNVGVAVVLEQTECFDIPCLLALGRAIWVRACFTFQSSPDNPISSCDRVANEERTKCKVIVERVKSSDDLVEGGQRRQCLC